MAMDAKSGRAADALADILFAEPYRFEFFQAVRLLERMFPERVPVGYMGGPGGEVVHFRTRASLAFPASQIHEIKGRLDESDEDDRPGSEPVAALEMFVNFMGLTGPLGTLPHHYTEALIDEQRADRKNTAYWEFLDIFNHRLISLFYRAWEKYRFHISYERGGGSHLGPERDGKDRFTEYLFDVLGLGTPRLRGRLGVADEGLLFYGGLIAQHPRSASAIAAIVGDYFGLPVQVEQFTGQWLALDEDSLTRLGRANSELGVNTIAGERVWDSQSKFRLSFGPLTFQEFLRLLPVNPTLGIVGKITRLLTGLEFDFDVRLRLRAAEVPECKLGSPTERLPMLGWTSWLKTMDRAPSEQSLLLQVKE